MEMDPQTSWRSSRMTKVESSGTSGCRKDWGAELASWHEITAVYILTNRKNGTLYTGVTSNLIKRIGQHRDGHIPGFTAKYGCKHLAWFETHGLISEAIRREKSIKSYRRQNKINLIEARNPEWRDLWFEIIK